MSFWRTLKSIGDIFGVTPKVVRAEKKAEQIAKNANEDESGLGNRYDSAKSNTGESVGDAVGQAVAHSDGDDE